MTKNKLSKYKQKKIIHCFSNELTATQTAKLLGINRNTINRYYTQFRHRIVAHQQEENKLLFGEIELDESYFGGHHNGAVGRSVKSKIPVFGILKRQGKVYTQIVPDVSKKTLQTIIKQRVKQGSVLYSDSWKSYDGLVINGYHHYRINHTTHFVLNKKNHINGIESFWSYMKNKLAKFYGIRSQDFYLYLKEYECRFNHRNENIYIFFLQLFLQKSR
nr:IS1595 family transposase [uncultured Flavobacterium sp.]